jgi:hypothetical protein
MNSSVDYIISIGDTCVPSELCTANDMHSNTLGAGLLFDWALSNLKCVCDITENGYEWFVANFIDNNRIYKTAYRFNELDHVHHRGNKNYKKAIARRYFDILQQNDIFIIFLYISSVKANEEDLIRFDNILKDKYHFDYKIIVAISSTEDKQYQVNENIGIYECISPAPFYGNKMRGEYYGTLFKKIIPYNLDNIKLV